MIRWFKIITVTIAAVLFAFCVYYPYTPRGMQARNMAIANQHIPVVYKVLEKDKRFAEVKLFAYTGLDGCLGVTGAVYSRSAMEHLQKAVESTDPPVAVYWNVRVLVDEQTK
jgi:hypothetical protein